MPLFPNAVKSRLEALKNKFNRKALVVPKTVAEKPTKPAVETKTVEFVAPQVDEGLSFREMQSRAKYNRNRAQRHKMKKHNKHQKKINPLHGVRC